MDTHDVPVLIVGGGVAGLAAAATLARYSIGCLVVERRTEPSTLPRATVISTRSMELVRSWGLQADVLDGGVDADVCLWECETLARAAEGRAHAVGMPTREQAAVVSPNAPEVVPQDWLEVVLRRHVGSRPAARLELGSELVALTNRADGVDATVRDQHGEERVVSARYAVAADGAHSVVRELLGVPMVGSDDVFSGMQAVFRAPLWQLLGDLRYALYWADVPGSPGTFLPAGRDDRWVYGIGATEEPVVGLDESQIIERIRRGAGVPDLPVHIERVGAFASVGELAQRFRVGSTFLVGDAAHRVTPRGGTGMNAALQGGYDLAWKLAWVLCGWSADELLDSYEAERRLVVEHNAARSTDPNGSRRRVEDELHVDLGSRIAHAWLPDSAHSQSTLDLLTPGWTLFVGPTQSAWTTAAAATSAGPPITVRAVDVMTARAIGVHGDGALLARPDGVPVAVWRSSAGAGRELAAATCAGARVPEGRAA